MFAFAGCYRTRVGLFLFDAAKHALREPPALVQAGSCIRCREPIRTHANLPGLCQGCAGFRAPEVVQPREGDGWRQRGNVVDCLLYDASPHDHPDLRDGNWWLTSSWKVQGCARPCIGDAPTTRSRRYVHVCAHVRYWARVTAHCAAAFARLRIVCACVSVRRLALLLEASALQLMQPSRGVALLKRFAGP